MEATEAVSAMKIDEKSPLTVVNSVKTDPAAAASAGSQAQRGTTADASKDTVELSSDVQRYAKAAEALPKVPEIRTERVAELKAAIKAGEYNVKARDVAEKMLMAMKKGIVV
ncbi:flagellar biosynthesis anti-sigma factor FlgM [Geotalea uraniireducens]|uniref:Negative regulator of flagellin synthesis n=1 Tax=Geotalea uraniireducens TaxID=351604 RepID=A0ABN6VQK4_9BACT|nr:flagellar biosynthesis anti-sigma factor FlgM [Geotalea uraniireducens]BDV42610.1 flagellar biosynthesis anti-sigma factor FlgM [Geotalea uraniireducens]